MKVSELIQKLQKAQKEHGDLHVVMSLENSNNFGESYTYAPDILKTMDRDGNDYIMLSYDC